MDNAVDVKKQQLLDKQKATTEKTIGHSNASQTHVTTHEGQITSHNDIYIYLCELLSTQEVHKWLNSSLIGSYSLLGSLPRNAE